MASKQFDRREVNHLFGGIFCLFIIWGESVESVKPGERVLGHPAKRLGYEFAAPVRNCIDFNVDI